MTTHFSLVRTTPPATEPVTLTEAKAHLRVDTNDDDALIGTLITVAREWAEQETQRAFITQTWRLTLDSFPAWNHIAPPPAIWERWPLIGLLPLGMAPSDVIPLPRPPLLSLTSAEYIDTTGATQTLDASLYTVDTDAFVGRLALNYAASWPATRPQRNAVTITYDAGYGPDETDVPAPIRQAILLAVGHWYENREPVNIGNITTPLPMACDALLAPYRVLEVA